MYVMHVCVCVYFVLCALSFACVRVCSVCVFSVCVWYVCVCGVCIVCAYVCGV